MMKKNHIFISFITLVCLCSCDQFLDVDPDNRATVNTKEKISALLVSAYPSSAYCFLTEMSSDNIDRMEKYAMNNDRMHEQFFMWRDVTETDNDSPHTIWEQSYKAIASANQALDAIEKTGNADGSLDAQKGEALMCRAYNHFVLVNVFCKHYGATSDGDLGIPYSTALENTVHPKYDRSTVAGVYALIEADIEEALPLIRDNEYSTPKFRFNRKAAHAFAARFFLYCRQYDKVIAHATNVLGVDPLLSLRDWASEGISTDYDIRGNAFVDSENRANLLLIPVYSLWGRADGPYSYGNYYIHNSFIATQESDQSTGPWGAASAFKFHSYEYTNDKVCNLKIKEFFEYTDPVARIGFTHIVQPAFTADETLLCRAEAYVMKKDYVNATNDLSLFMRNYSTGTILTRTNIRNYYNNLAYYEFNAPTPKKRLNPDFGIEAGEQENFIHCVLHIRRILTRSEGLRWFDIKRYGIEIHRRSISGNNEIISLGVLKVDDPRRALQIPMDVINAGLPSNPRTNQNH